MKFSSVFCSIDSFVQMDLFNFHQFQSVSVELTWNRIIEFKIWWTVFAPDNQVKILLFVALHGGNTIGLELL